MSIADKRDDKMEKDRRGRRLKLSCRLFFFGRMTLRGKARYWIFRPAGVKPRHPLPYKLEGF